MTKTEHSRYEKDFQRSTIACLRRRGIAIIGATWLPGPGGTFANGERGYLLDDSGTQRVAGYLDVLSMAFEVRA